MDEKKIIKGLFTQDQELKINNGDKKIIRYDLDGKTVKKKFENLKKRKKIKADELSKLLIENFLLDVVLKNNEKENKHYIAISDFNNLSDKIEDRENFEIYKMAISKINVIKILYSYIDNYEYKLISKIQNFERDLIYLEKEVKENHNLKDSEKYFIKNINKEEYENNYKSYVESLGEYINFKDLLKMMIKDNNYLDFFRSTKAINVSFPSIINTHDNKLQEKIKTELLNYVDNAISSDLKNFKDKYLKVKDDFFSEEFETPLIFFDDLKLTTKKLDIIESYEEIENYESNFDLCDIGLYDIPTYTDILIKKYIDEYNTFMGNNKQFGYYLYTILLYKGLSLDKDFHYNGLDLLISTKSLVDKKLFNFDRLYGNETINGYQVLYKTNENNDDYDNYDNSEILMKYIRHKNNDILNKHEVDEIANNIKEIKKLSKMFYYSLYVAYLFSKSLNFPITDFLNTIRLKDIHDNLKITLGDTIQAFITTQLSDNDRVLLDDLLYEFNNLTLSCFLPYITDLSIATDIYNEELNIFRKNGYIADMPILLSEIMLKIKDKLIYDK